MIGEMGGAVKFFGAFQFCEKEGERGRDSAEKRRIVQTRNPNSLSDGWGMRFLKIAYTFPGILFLAIQKQIGKMRKGKVQTEDGNGLRK
ncbi:MAG: hypothetical protein HDT27_03020 [Subdoligranulum sp.]|nr:hypothetical protein [Subdoligranulum sp.]